MSEAPPDEPAEPELPLTAPVIATLVANHREFLAFVQRRVGDRALAEEILQDAFVRGMANEKDVRENAVGWFYRLLRNAVVDAQRRRAAAARRLDAFAQEPGAAQADEELERVVCKCVGELASTLKPEYASALRRIDVEGVAVKDYAAEMGISTSNAGVRVFRAREALRNRVARSCGTCADHGCLDCSCETAPGHRQ